MARFAIAKINFFDNDLKHTLKEYSDLDTAYATEAREDEILFEGEQFESIQRTKQLYFDCDMMIDIIEI